MNKVSIIIPTCNSLPMLKTCVESVRTHTAQPHEIIVCDRGSTDGTLSWCRSQPIVLLSLPRHARLSDACSTGLRVASGDALMILGADTLAAPNWLAALAEALHSAPDAGLVGPVSNRANTWQQLLPPLDPPSPSDPCGGEGESGEAGETESPDESSGWLEAEHLDSFCVLMKREVWQRCGPLPEGGSPEDMGLAEFCRKAALAGYRSIVTRRLMVLRQLL